MPAFVIVDVEIKDPVRYEEYKKMAGATVAAFGGRFVVRGGATETLEGTWRPGRLVVLEFPSAQRAKEWWDSEMYRPAKALRQAISTADMVLVEGA